MLHLYLWFKVFHIFSVIIWFSGMLWMPFLLLQHDRSQSDETRIHFAQLERKLMRGIITPAMISTLIFGICLVASQPQWLQQGWLHAKLLLVLALTGFHGLLARQRRQLESATAANTLRLARIRYLPFVALGLVLALVVLKPF